MACDCENFACLQAHYNPCSEGVEIDITADYTGPWTADIEYNGTWSKISFGVVDGEKIVLPTAALNENYTHQARIYDESGNLVNDTCYHIESRALIDGGIYDVLPPNVADYLQEQIDDLNDRVTALELLENGIRFTMVSEADSYTNGIMENRDVISVDFNGGAYNTGYNKPFASNTIFFTDFAPVPAGTVITIHFA